MKEVVLFKAKRHIPKRHKKSNLGSHKPRLILQMNERRLNQKGIQWSQMNREVTRSVKEDKKSFIESKCEEIEKCKGDSKKVFQVLKEVINKKTSKNDAINDKNGVTLTDNEEIKARWAEHTSKLFEAQDHQQTYNRGRNEAEPPPLRSEVEAALQQIKNEKSPGFDDIQAELWKATGEEGVNVLWRL